MYPATLFYWLRNAARSLRLATYAAACFALGIEYATSFWEPQREPLAPPPPVKLMTAEQQTRHELISLLGNVGFRADEVPEFRAALKKPGEGISTIDLVRRRQEILAAIPREMPAEGWVSSTFGPRAHDGEHEQGFHKGIDIAAGEGTIIRAPSNGIVRFAGRYGGFGNYLAIVHGFGIVTKYAHCATLLVEAGQEVKIGDPIATVGQSGRSRGIHLHYEVWFNDKAANPMAFLPDFRQSHGTPLTQLSSSDFLAGP